MGNEHLISIILPSYNLSKYIWRTIESVIAQTYKNWELIVIDDGSSDDSIEVIKKYAESETRIKPTYLEKNVGMCTVFNIALEQAKGKYIARIDADDFWEPEKLAKQYNYMESNPSCGASFTWVKVIDENEQELPTTECEGRDRTFNSENRTRAQWLRTFFFEGCRVCHPSAMIRKAALDAIGGKYNYIYSQVQDYDLWIRIVKKYDIYVLPEKLTNYRWFISDSKNVSASSAGTLTRGLYELYLIMSHFYDDISDELFYEAFSGDMYYDKAKSNYELACERAFIMYHKSYASSVGRVVGLSMLAELYNNDEARDILINFYGFTAKTYAEWISNSLFNETNNVFNVTAQRKSPKKEAIKKILQKYPPVFKFVRACYLLIKKIIPN
jgi:glycosyltransferase involved in cell wall biosynthesis